MKQKSILSTVLACFALFAILASSVFAAQSTVNLRSASEFVILAKSGISTTGTTMIKGNIGVSPIDSTAITGFGLIADASNQFSSASLLTGKAYASNYAPPTPTMLTTAVSDMQTAYTDAAGRSLPDHTELGAGNIDGMTLAPGLYKWGTGVSIPNTVTLSGGSNDVWIFQIAQDLDVGNGAIVSLSGGAQAKNVFWQVAGQTTLGTTSVMNGNILDQTAIVMKTGSSLNGRALAQTAVTLDASTVTMPGNAPVIIPPVVIPPKKNSTNSTNATWHCTAWQACLGGLSQKVCESDIGGRTVEKRVCETEHKNETNTTNGNSTWNCSAWTACTTEGMRTKVCENGNGGRTIPKETCVPARREENNEHKDSEQKSDRAENTGSIQIPAKNDSYHMNGTAQPERAAWWDKFTSWCSKLFAKRT